MTKWGGAWVERLERWFLLSGWKPQSFTEGTETHREPGKEGRGDAWGIRILNLRVGPVGANAAGSVGVCCGA